MSDYRTQIGACLGSLSWTVLRAPPAPPWERQAELDRNATRETLVSSLAGALSRLSHGDTDCRIDTPFPEEYEPLRADFNTAVQRLGAVLNQVTVSVQKLRGNASELSGAAGSLLQRTERQAATLEQTAGYIAAMVGRGTGTPWQHPIEADLILALLFGILLSMPIAQWGIRLPQRLRAGFEPLYIMMLMGFSMLLLINGTHNPFLYFRF